MMRTCHAYGADVICHAPRTRVSVRIADAPHPDSGSPENIVPGKTLSQDGVPCDCYE